MSARVPQGPQPFRKSTAREYFELADKAAAAPPKVDFSQPAKKP